MSNVPRVGRNDPCPCGSGQRYKHCCGRLSDAPQPPLAGRTLGHVMGLALQAQQARRLSEAEALYREALEIDPHTADALHMLGVVRFELGDDPEAKQLILRALELTDWQHSSFRHNLGLVLARLHADLSSQSGKLLKARYREWSSLSPRPTTGELPTVAVVVPVYNHARYVESALESVFRQDYPHIELVVIDDGSSDESPALARQALKRCPFPSKFIARANRGAPQTINEGVALSKAAYVNVLNSDDLFPPGRIRAMAGAVAATRSAWGFSGIEVIDSDGQGVDPLKNLIAYSIACKVAGTPLLRTAGFALMEFNISVSSGNLFFARTLWEELGGFRDFRYNHDWDFALRALWLEEPRFIADPLYRYRLHGTNTITESASSSKQEAMRVSADYLSRAVSTEVPRNSFAPALATWGTEFVVELFSGGLGQVLSARDATQLVALLERSAG